MPEELKAAELAVVTLNASIQRLASTASALKATSLTVSGALLSFLLSKDQGHHAWTALPIAATFAYVDARYLATERELLSSMRTLLEKMAKQMIDAADVVVLSPRVGLSQTWAALRSWSTFPVYGLQVLAIIAAGVGASTLKAPASVTTGTPVGQTRELVATNEQSASTGGARQDAGMLEIPSVEARPDSGAAKE